MKKLLLLILVLSMAFSIVSCAGVNDAEETSSSLEETTETTNTTETTETTCYTDCSKTTETTEITDMTETTVNHPHGGTGGTTETSLETTGTETTASIDRYNLGMEYIMEYEAFIMTDGDEYKPYTSTIYYQNPYMVGDGILMFVSMENQLPYWIEEDVIPHIDINEGSDVRFEYDTENAELKHSGRFRIYMQEETGAFAEVKAFENADLAEIFAYGKENLAGKTVYISYSFLLQTGDFAYLSDRMFGCRAVHDIMCLFKTAF